MHAIKRYGAAAAVIMASLLLLLSACMRAPSLSEVLDRDIIKDDYTILHSIDVANGQLVFYQRQTYRDIGLAAVNNSLERSSIQYSGQLSTAAGTPNRHYFSMELEGQPYSIYFGRLDEPRQGPVSIRFWDAENEEEALVHKASVLNIEGASLWYMVFDHRYEKLFDVIDQQDNG